MSADPFRAAVEALARTLHEAAATGPTDEVSDSLEVAAGLVDDVLNRFPEEQRPASDAGLREAVYRIGYTDGFLDGGDGRLPKEGDLRQAWEENRDRALAAHPAPDGGAIRDRHVRDAIRDLVEEAFREGWYSAKITAGRTSDHVNSDWRDSDVRKAMLRLLGKDDEAIGAILPAHPAPDGGDALRSLGLSMVKGVPTYARVPSCDGWAEVTARIPVSIWHAAVAAAKLAPSKPPVPPLSAPDADALRELVEAAFREGWHSAEIWHDRRAADSSDEWLRSSDEWLRSDAREALLRLLGEESP